ncbi:Canalicular multispecific organic anion transporter 1 [Coemansia sp. RSA 1939]|nr:Canalicular multispecific organic anion transporter 1 [Coemansia sp. RSA 1939]
MFGKILAALDESDPTKSPTAVRVFGYIVIAACAHVVKKQSVRMRNWRKDEQSRIADTIERVILRKPLQHSALHNEHMYRYSNFHPLELTQTVFDVLGHVSDAIRAATSVIMVAHSMGGDRAIAGWVVPGTIVLCLATRVARVAVDWATSRRIVLQSYDHIEEICASITSIKLYAWESKYIQWANTYYDDDDDDVVYSRLVRVVRKLSKVVFEVFNGTMPHLITLVAVQSFFTSQPQELPMSNAELLKTKSQLHLLVEQVIGLFKSAIHWQNVRESNRIVEFCLNPQTNHTVSAKEHSTAEFAVELDDCNLTWGGDAPILHNVSLRIAHGQMVMVTGPVGQGKSSLLCAIAREMEVSRGTGYSSGRVVHVPQRGFIMSGRTIRDNITFGNEYNQERYKKVTDACALGLDFALLANGDLTTVGDRGATVSGGQHARIVLARSLYTDADTYLLDDTLAAVDPMVARYLLDRVLLGSDALLLNKTRILVTSTETVLPFADLVVRVADGQIKTTVSQTPKPFNPHSPHDAHPSPHLRHSSFTTKPEPKTGSTSSKRQNIQKADVASPTSKSNNFMYYFRICGWTVISLAASLAIIDGFAWSYVQRKLRDILTESRNQTQCKSAQREAIVRYLQIDYVATTIRMSFIHLDTLLETYITKRHCAPHINAGFIRGIVHSPLSFFSSTPEPMIATAFYSSTAMIRGTLPYLLKLELMNVVSLLAALYRVWTTIPLVAVFVVPAVVYSNALLDGVFLPVQRTVSEAGIIIRTHMVQAWQTVVNGAHAIRGLGRAEHFMEQLMKDSDVSVKHSHITMSTSALCDTMRCIMREAIKVMVIMAFFVFRHARGLETTLGSAHAVDFINNSSNLIYMVEMVAKIKQRLVDYSSYIRSYRQFADLPSESDGSKKKKPGALLPVPEQWPDQGAIRFAGYSMRYNEQAQRALDNITLEIQPGEKIGVVGRTGAGKSSLAKALFRLVEGEAGSIQIDGIDISEIELSDLRSRLAIIPQDPALFYGSVRDNLDPLHQHTVEDIWAAIIKAQLVDLINRKEVTELGKVVVQEAQHLETPSSALSLSSVGHERERRQRLVAGPHKCWRRIRVDSRSPVLRSGLGKWIEFEGRNFSIGQRQLVSLCRALLRSRKILVLDEATANVDPHTDRIMHAAIGNEFKDSTVITIAHRLDTVLGSSDRIVVMDGGKVVQVGKPQALLAQMDGPFAQLVHEFSANT